MYNIVKHFLCDAVGGKAKDVDAMLKVEDNLRSVECYHIDTPLNGKATFYTEHVELNDYVILSRYVSSVGRCSVCGRIYYNGIEEVIHDNRRY